jgi:hypothetical protein
MLAVGRQVGAMHVATIKKRHVDKTGQERLYTSYLLRRTFREDGKVKHETLANLSALPDEQVDLLRRSLKGEEFTPVGAPPQVLRSLPHGHVAAVLAQVRTGPFPIL